MGQLFWEAGLETVFVNTNPSRAELLNRRGCYPLRILDAYSRTVRELTIDRFKVLTTQRQDDIAEAISEARIVATAVGVANLGAIAPLMAGGIRRRFENRPDRSISTSARTRSTRPHRFPTR